MIYLEDYKEYFEASLAKWGHRRFFELPPSSLWLVNLPYADDKDHSLTNWPTLDFPIPAPVSSQYLSKLHHPAALIPSAYTQGAIYFVIFLAFSL